MIPGETLCFAPDMSGVGEGSDPRTRPDKQVREEKNVYYLLKPDATVLYADTTVSVVIDLLVGKSSRTWQRSG